ncbi:leucine--tRNA ligase-like [Panonychus citri]|uniref:leucine--tRNA ligase-like n=1 Tax=Panonychus citri TaxID=50023 RepID=UPI002307B253|nr:leucine--tRNA ligase-like [Panonychus citri]
MKMILLSVKRFVSFSFYNYRCLFSSSGHWPITCSFDHKCTLNYFKEIENHWKPILDRKWKIYSQSVDQTSPNHKYVLAMFPYPSGSLHLGHVRIYTTSEVMARFLKLRGFSVTNPMGWDSFGLPAENAALERSFSPATWTYQNISNMEGQIKSLGLFVNWREATSDASFYRWTQWLFLQLFKSGLLFKSMSRVNWDPVDKTVLADDQVDANGLSWRSGAKVEKRFLRQWAVKISAFHEQLYDTKNIDMDNPSWKELIANQQFFLGQPDSFIFYFQTNSDILPVLCDYPEYLKSHESYVAVNDEHWITKQSSQKIINPLNGKEMKIVILPDDKLPQSGRAEIMNPNNVICEETRKLVLEECSKLKLGGYRTSKRSHDWIISRQRYWGTPIPIINCPSCGTVPVPESNLPIELPPVKDLNRLYCSSNNDGDKVTSRLESVAPNDWLNVSCPKCGNPSVRETDTCDTFVDSSWYYLRYATDPQDSQPFNKVANTKPVDIYVGGAEHCRGHLLYARYIYYFLKSKGFLETDSSEPFDNLLFLGYVLGRTIKLNNRFVTEDEYQQLIDSGTNSPDDFEITFEKMSKSKGNGVNPMELINTYGVDLTRTSLLGFGLPRREREWHGSKVEFEEIFVLMRRLFLTVEQFIYIREVISENPKGPVIRRFMLTQNIEEQQLNKTIDKLNRERKKTIEKVTSAFENIHPALGINMLKNFLFLLRKSVLNLETCSNIEFERCLGDTIIMFGPVIPHLAEECWSAFSKYAHQTGHKKYYDFDELVMEQKWPTID